MDAARPIQLELVILVSSSADHRAVRGMLRPGEGRSSITAAAAGLGSRHGGLRVECNAVHLFHLNRHVLARAAVYSFEGLHAALHSVLPSVNAEVEHMTWTHACACHAEHCTVHKLATQVQHRDMVMCRHTSVVSEQEL